MATLPSSESDFSEIGVEHGLVLSRSSPACRSRAISVAASASLCARRPSWPSGVGFLPVDHRVDEGLELVPVGGGVALEEEVLHRVGGEAAAPAISTVVSCTLSAAACPSSRAPRCAGRSRRWRGASWRSGDLAGRRLHQHRGGVDVAGLADRRVDQRRAEGEDLDRLLAEQEARHVEIVDHHVAEEPAGALDVGDRRRRRDRATGW